MLHKVTKRDEMINALKVVQYVPESQYNLISIGVLDEEGEFVCNKASSQLAKETGQSLKERSVEGYRS